MERPRGHAAATADLKRRLAQIDRKAALIIAVLVIERPVLAPVVHLRARKVP